MTTSMCPSRCDFIIAINTVLCNTPKAPQNPCFSWPYPDAMSAMYLKTPTPRYETATSKPHPTMESYQSYPKNLKILPTAHALNLSLLPNIISVHC